MNMKKTAAALLSASVMMSASAYAATPVCTSTVAANHVELSVLNAGKLTEGKEIAIQCNGAHETGKCDFIQNVSGMKITAPNGQVDSLFPEGQESAFEKIGYTVGNMLNSVIIGEDTLNQAFAHDETGAFIAGEYTITMTAANYGDVTVTVNVAAAEKIAPQVASVTYVKQFMGGNYYTVAFDASESEAAAFVQAISGITVNGQKIKRVSSFFNDKLSYKIHNDPAFGGKACFVSFTEDCFQGEADVVISADGYSDLAFTLVDGKLPVEAAPVVADIVRAGGIMGQYDRVSFVGDVTSYLPAITSITLNGVDAKNVTSLFGETKAYKFSNDSAFGGENCFIDFTTDCFAGEVTVVIKAAGYADLTLTLVDGKIPDMTAPVVADINRTGSVVMGQYDRVSFEGDVSAYLSAITSITLNGAEAKKVTNLFGETAAYKFSNDPVYGGENCFIDFTADCFVGTVEVVVTAKGYETLTFTVVDGKLAPAVQAAPAVSGLTYKTQFMGGNYYIAAFEADEATAADFVAAISSITVNGQKIKRVTSFFNDTLSYKFSKDPAFGGAEKFVDFTADCFQGKAEVVISADGYADLTFTVIDGQLAQ